MIDYPTIDPIIFSLGPLHVHWYGLMYVIGFVSAYALVAKQAKRIGWQKLLDNLDGLNLALIIGVILGGRLGYVLFYNLSYYMQHPLEIGAIWTGGMSFHGGAAGALLAGFFYAKKTKLDFWQATDLFVPTVPIGLFFGRLGNFINGELYGRVTDAPWAMIFPEGGPLPRHPSQLYEAFFEGLILFIILWSLRKTPWQKPPQRLWPHGSMLALFLLIYGVFRFYIEFCREPDSQLGFVMAHFSMGQVLCVVMSLIGAFLWWWRCQSTPRA